MAKKTDFFLAKWEGHDPISPYLYATECRYFVFVDLNYMILLELHGSLFLFVLHIETSTHLWVYIIGSVQVVWYTSRGTSPV